MARKGQVTVLLLALAGCGFSHRAYRESWEPVRGTDDQHLVRLVDRALFVRPEEVDALKGAGATLVGFHSTRKGWSTRAASTGGTHFLPVEEMASGSRTTCVAWSAGAVTCASHEVRGRWSRVAVFRVEPDRWHLLPDHLVPPEDDVEEGVAPSAVRLQCSVHRHWGDVRCGNDWSIQRR